MFLFIIQNVDPTGNQCKQLTAGEKGYRKLRFVKKFKEPLYVGDSGLHALAVEVQRQLTIVSWVERTRFILSKAEAGLTALKSVEENVTYQQLTSLIDEGKYLMTSNVCSALEQTPMYVQLLAKWKEATATYDRLHQLLNSTTDESLIDGVYKEIQSSTIRYTKLLFRVNGALDIQRWILGAKIILKGTQRTRNYLKQQIMTCPVAELQPNEQATSATHTFALDALQQLKKLKKDADAWNSKIYQVLGAAAFEGTEGADENQRKENEPKPTPGVVSSDLGYYCCLDDESLSGVCKKLQLDTKEMLRTCAPYIVLLVCWVCV